MDQKDLNLQEYGITENRYRELLYFCRQYPEWQRRLTETRSVETLLSPTQYTGMPGGGKIGTPTEAAALRNLELRKRCELVEKTARKADAELSEYVLMNVTRKGVGYQTLREVKGMPCGKSTFFKARRKFFCLLDQKHDAGVV